MWRATLILLGALLIANGVYLFVAPQTFYDSVPGVSMMGPFNAHFIRDAGLSFLVSGGALLWGAWAEDEKIAIFGAVWPCLHATFHAYIWIARGFPADTVAFVNLFGIQAPAWLALTSAMNFQKRRKV